ncbi:MAG: BamA/TamA family outer membrane protein [Bacteroidetes bacterium]|nr:BamA/TamA family outer membrane protein [Bacteroidota bacterium]
MGLKYILFITFLFLSASLKAKVLRDTVKTEVRYSEKNIYDTINVYGDKQIVRRDSLRKHFSKYIPKNYVVSYNSIDYISSAHLKMLLSQEHKKNKNKNKSVLISGAPFPFYKPTTSFGFGGAGVLSFKYDKKDTVSFRSYVPFSLLISVKGQFEFGTGMDLFMHENRFKTRFRLDATKGLANYFEYNGTLKFPSIDDKSTQYDHLLIEPEVEMLWSVAKNFYIGPSLYLRYEKLSKMSDDVKATLPLSFLNNPEVFSMGLGFMCEYSSIDNPTFPYHGLVANASIQEYYEFMAEKKAYTKITLDYRQYQELFNRCALAWQVKAEGVVGQETDLFMLKPAVYIRGVMDRYYISPLVGNISTEYRQYFGSQEAYERGSYFARVGYTLWANMGVWGDKLNSLNTVFSVGGGLRYEIQQYKNIRFDVGTPFDKNAKLFYYVSFLEFF